MKNILISAGAGAAFLAFAGVAAADTMVSATTDLNVRAGPGPEYQVIGFLGAGQQAPLTGCLQNSRWCTVSTANGNGWVYSDYLTAEEQGQRVVIAQRPAGVVVPDVTSDGPAAPVDTTVTSDIVGPEDDLTTDDAMATDDTIGTIQPPSEVRTYVVDHRRDPVYLNGEVVVGAGLPDNVELTEIPDYQYRYVDVNGQPVLVDPQTRRIVYIVRQ
jgi:uncharacterized protein YraI